MEILGNGDCLLTGPHPLVTVAPMTLGCRGTTVYLQPLHYLARANMQSSLLVSTIHARPLATGAIISSMIV